MPSETGAPVDPALDTSKLAYTTAPVAFPARDQLTVKLAPVNLISQWKTAESDKDLCLSLASILSGGGVGVLVNMATMQQPTMSLSAWPIPAVFCGMAFVGLF